MIGYIKKRPIIAAILAATFAATPATVLAQTEETATAPVLDVVSRSEMDQRLNEFRSEYLNHRADSITWALTVVTVIFAILGLVVAIVGFVGFKNLRSIESDAHKRAIEAGKYATEASKHAEETKAHRTRAEKDALAIREMTSEDAADPAKAEQVEKAVETVQQTPDASPIDKAIAMAHSLQKAGETEKAIEKWRAVGHLMDGVDNEFASRAIASVGYLLESPQDQISAYSEAIRLDPSSSAAYNNRGSAKSALKQHLEAIQDYDEAIRLDPSNFVAYTNRSGAKNELKQHEEAIQDCDQAIRLDPNNALAYYSRAFAKGNLNRIDEARSDFQTALRLAKEQGNEELATAVADILRKMNNSEKN